jgi:DNA repair exonuclease SbcCD ATPase subunit
LGKEGYESSLTSSHKELTAKLVAAEHSIAELRREKGDLQIELQRVTEELAQAQQYIRELEARLSSKPVPAPVEYTIAPSPKEYAKAPSPKVKAYIPVKVFSC